MAQEKLQPNQNFLDTVDSLRQDVLAALNTVIVKIVEDRKSGSDDELEGEKLLGSPRAESPLVKNKQHEGASSSNIAERAPNSSTETSPTSGEGPSGESNKPIPQFLRRLSITFDSARRGSSVKRSQNNSNASIILENASTEAIPPSPIPLDNVRQLEQMSPAGIISHQDHQLAMALAALCSSLYTVLDESTVTGHVRSNSRENLAVASEDACRILSDVERTVNPALVQLWNEVDKLSSLVSCMIIQRQVASQSMASLADSHANMPPPPTYAETTRSSMAELTTVLTALERISHAAPKLFNQTVTLTERQSKNFDVAALKGLIDRLMANREDFQEQRASPATKYDKLNKLVEQVMQAGSRTLSNQRVELTPSQQDKMEQGRILGMMNKQMARRMANQDWESHESRLLKDLAQLYKNMNGNCKLGQQRFVMSPAKEKDMFINNILGKLDRLESRRMDNQEAVSPLLRKQSDMEKLVERLSTSRMNDQRTPQTPKSPM